MSGWDSRDEPELVTEPVVLECAICGQAVQVDPADHEDEDEYVCLDCHSDARKKYGPIYQLVMFGRSV